MKALLDKTKGILCEDAENQRPGYDEDMKVLELASQALDFGRECLKSALGAGILFFLIAALVIAGMIYLDIGRSQAVPEAKQPISNAGVYFGGDVNVSGDMIVVPAK